MDIKVSTSYSLIVRYLPEVVPFFRKASILSEIGWSLPEDVESIWNNEERDSESISPSTDSGSLHHQASDSKTIPLFGACIRRLHLIQILKKQSPFTPDDSDTTFTTTDNSSSDGQSTTYEVFVIQSPDLSKSCVFRFDNDIQRSSWFRAIQNTINKFNSSIIEVLNRTNKCQANFDSKLVYIGWFCQLKKASLLESLFSEVINTSAIFSHNF